MLPSLSEQPLNFSLLVFYYLSIILTAFFCIKPFILGFKRVGCKSSKSYHDYFTIERGKGKCDGCYTVGFFDSLLIIIGALFFLLLNPPCWFGIVMNCTADFEGVKEMTSWPLTRKQATWLWDNGVVFLPVLATLLVWLV